MFEEKITPAGIERPTDGELLRAPEWADLVARLAASRELRQAMVARRMEASGNFDSFATHHGGMVKKEEDVVNPDNSIDGKGPRDMVPIAANGAVTCDRETQ